MVIRICVCTHSSLEHQRLPYGEQPCHCNISGPCSSHPSPSSLLPQHLHSGASWQLCPCLLHPGTPPGHPWDPAVLPLRPALPQGYPSPTLLLQQRFPSPWQG